MTELPAIRVGLEVHVRLATATKLFSPAPCGHGGDPNTRLHPHDLALPGTLPTTNVRAVELALRAALVLGCAPQRVSRFVRKHYAYPDLPKGWQTTQQDEPLALGGAIPCAGGTPWPLRRLHLEEDAGRLVHDGAVTFVDLDRAGVPLIEIVTEPRIASPAEVRACLQALRETLQFAGVTEGDMERGELRVDANVSLADAASTSPRVELKNLNSFRNVAAALAHEARRQADVVRSGGVVAQQTRAFDVGRGVTFAMREKVDAEAYTFLDEANLPELVVDDALLARVRADLPASAAARRARIAAQHSIDAATLDVLVTDRRLVDCFEATVALGGDGRRVAHCLVHEVLGRVHPADLGGASPRLTPQALAELVTAVTDGVVAPLAAKSILDRMLTTGVRVADAIAALDVGLIADDERLLPIVDAVLAEHRDAVDAFRSGVAKAFHALVGDAQRRLRGRAAPAALERLLRARLRADP
jgi:aspartyl-tRNA(Asn)/glutamyl-tRNA(Gln) amidotransferase subunit B